MRIALMTAEDFGLLYRNLPESRRITVAGLPCPNLYVPELNIVILPQNEALLLAVPSGISTLSGVMQFVQNWQRS